VVRSAFLKYAQGRINKPMRPLHRNVSEKTDRVKRYCIIDERIVQKKENILNGYPG
jgi:hypothetical protein